MVGRSLTPTERLSRHKWLEFVVVNEDGEVYDPLGSRVDSYTERELQRIICRYLDDKYEYRPNWCSIRL